MSDWARVHILNKTFRILPIRGVRGAAGAIAVVLILMGAVEWSLQRRQRLDHSSPDAWRRQNEWIAAESRAKDRRELFAVPREAVGTHQPRETGVCAWVGHSPVRQRGRKHRVLVVGDSFVWQTPYHNNNQFWWRQLQIELERRGRWDVEVIAVGSSGASTRFELVAAQSVIKDWAPDLVLWGYVTNDADEGILPQSTPIRTAIHGAGIARKVFPVWADLLLSKRFEKLGRRVSTLDYQSWELALLRGDNWLRYQQTVEAWGQATRGWGIPVVVVTLPAGPSPVYFEPRYEPVLPLFEKQGAKILNLLPLLIERYGVTQRLSEWGLNPVDGHPGPRSTRFFARAVADMLEKDHPNLIGPVTQRVAPPRINDWLPASLVVSGAESNVLTLAYPSSADKRMSLYVDQPVAMLALERPSPLSTVQLRGAAHRAARLWACMSDPVEHHDTMVWTDLGRVDGADATWRMPRGDVSMLLLWCDTAVEAAPMTLTLAPPDHASTDRGDKAQAKPGEPGGSPAGEVGP